MDSHPSTPELRPETPVQRVGARRPWWRFWRYPIGVQSLLAVDLGRADPPRHGNAHSLDHRTNRAVTALGHTHVPAPGGAPSGGPAVIGVLGGMGPAATADFYNKLVEATPATRDQDHRRVVIWSDPTVPDRSDALHGRAPDPTPWLLNGARILREAGATIIAIPCNTAHAFVPAIADLARVPIAHMIDEVARTLIRTTPRVRRAGLLATTGTVRGRLYQDWLERAGIDVVVPDGGDQEAVMAAVRSIKSGRADLAAADLAAAGRRLSARGAEVVIGGCTEIPLALTQDDLDVPMVDPTWVLAEAVVGYTAHPSQHPDRAAW